MMPYKIALIFTEKVSLKLWKKSGLIIRDTLLYERLCALGHEVTFVTYGKLDDARHLPEGSRIKVLSRTGKRRLETYGRFLPLIHFRKLKNVDLIKSHQLKGGRHAAWSSIILRKPFIARCGYLPSVFLKNEGAAQAEQKRALREEQFTFRHADAAFVPGATESRYIQDHFGVPSSKIHLMPNWIDTERFAPLAEPAPPTRRVCFIGRFSDQKQPLLLLEAMEKLPDAELLMIGGGELEAQIREKAANAGIRATILGRIPNEELPDLLRSCSVYALPTRHEGGSPKTLLEAMACALPVIGTNAFGIDDAFVDGEHGIKLSPDDGEGLARSLRWIFDHPEEARAMGDRGRRHVIDHYSVDRAVQKELEVYDALLGPSRSRQ